MILTVQLIVVEWTKRSRGAPESSFRNAVPECYPIVEHPSACLSIQEVRYSEFGQFRDPGFKWRTDLRERQIYDLRLDIKKERDALSIGFWGHQLRERYPCPKRVATLPNGSYSRIRANARYSWEDTWAYQKHVYNIAWTEDAPPQNLFSQSDPAEQFDDLVQLY